MIQRLFHIASSWWLHVLILIILIGCYIHKTGSEGEFLVFIDFLFNTPTGILLYIILLLNLLFITIRIIFNHLSTRPPAISSMDTFVEIKHSQEVWQQIRKSFKTFNLPSEITEKMIYIKKGRWSLIPGTILRTGIIIFLFSLLLSYHVRSEKERIIHEGALLKLQSRELKVKKIIPHMDKEFLQVGDSSVFEVKKVAVLLEDKERTYHIDSSYPVKIGKYYLKVTHLGLSHKLDIEKNNSKVQLIADLDIFPPGKTALLSVNNEDTFFTFTLIPDKTIKKGILTGRLYNLSKVKYKLVMQKGKKNIISTMEPISPGQTVTFDNYKISLGRTSYYIIMKYVYDPGLKFLKAGLFLLTAGLVLMFSRFFWYKKDFMVIKGAGTITIGYREEFFKKWGINRFHKLLDEID